MLHSCVWSLFVPLFLIDINTPITMYVVLSHINVLVSCFSDLQSIGLYCIFHKLMKSDVLNFLVIKSTRCTNFINLFCHETLHVFGQFVCPSSGVYSLYTEQWYNDPARKLSETCITYTIAKCTVNKLLMMDRRTVQNM